MKTMDRISRGNGFRGAINYIYANFKASFLCASNVLATVDQSRTISKMGVLARRLRPDIKKPVWHQAMRLIRSEVISHEIFREIAHEYMRRMGWNIDKHQYVVIVSDDPKGQHIHIVANRVAIDGNVFLGKNENLISTRVCHELEREFGLTMSEAPEYVLDHRGIAKAVYSGAKDRKEKKGELRLAERQVREGDDKPLPRKTLQRVLKTALAAGERGGLAAFLSTAEAGGVRVLANVAATGKVNGLSFETGSVPFRASQVGDPYAWASLSTTVRYDKIRDQAVLEARSLRHVTRDQLPPLGQPAPSPQLPAPPAAANRIVIPAAKEAADHVHYQSAYRARRAASPPPGRLARTPALGRLRSLPRSGLDDLGGRAGRLAEAQGLLPRDSQLELRGPVKSGYGLRYPAGGVAEPAAVASQGLERNPPLLNAVREAKAVRELFNQVRDGITGTEGRTMRVVAISLSSALDDFRPKGGKLGTLYIRESTDTYSFLATPEVVKVARIEPDVVRAALAVAAQQWQRLTICGGDEFKRLAAREAVRLGLADRVANPELQHIITAERARLAALKSHVVDSHATSAPTPGAGVPNSLNLETPSRIPVSRLTPRRTPRPR